MRLPVAHQPFLDTYPISLDKIGVAGMGSVDVGCLSLKNVMRIQDLIQSDICW